MKKMKRKGFGLKLTLGSWGVRVKGKKLEPTATAHHAWPRSERLLPFPHAGLTLLTPTPPQWVPPSIVGRPRESTLVGPSYAADTAVQGHRLWVPHSFVKLTPPPIKIHHLVLQHTIFAIAFVNANFFKIHNVECWSLSGIHLIIISQCCLKHCPNFIFAFHHIEPSKCKIITYRNWENTEL